MGTKEIVALRKKYPCYSLQKIGKLAGLSRERIRQILSRAGERTARLPHGNCLHCGKVLTRRKARFCNGDCRHLYSNPEIECSQCGVHFRRQLSSLYHNKTLFFCSKRCQGRWLGRTYGFKKHTHYWILDSQNHGVCECGATCQKPTIAEIENKLARRSIQINPDRIGNRRVK